MSGNVAVLGLQIDGNNALKATGAMKGLTAAAKETEAAFGRAGKSAQSATQQMAERTRLIERAEREWQQKQQASARRQVAEAAENGRKQAVALMGALERQFKLDMARVREGQARGFLTEAEARAAGREAATAYNQGVVQALDRGGGAVGLGQQQFTRMAGSLKNIDTESRRAGLGVGQLRETMGSLAARAAGTHPVVGQLAGVIGSFAYGSAMMVGVLAGLAALALAWNKITEKSREAKEETERAMDALAEAARQQALGPLGEAPGQGATADAELNRLLGLQRRLELLQEGGGAVGGRLKTVTEQIEQARANSAAATTLIAESAARVSDEVTRNEVEAARDRAAIARQEAAERLAIHEKFLADLEALDERFRRRMPGGIGGPQSVGGFAPNAEGRAASIAGQAERASLAGKLNLTPVSVAGNVDRTVASTGGGGGISGMLGGLMSGIGGALSSAAGPLLAAFGPLAAAAAVLKPVFEGLMEAVGPVLSALAEPLRTIGTLLGAYIAPALKVLQPLLDGLAKGFSYLISAQGWLIRAIGKAVNFLLPGNPGNGLVKWGQSMMDQAEAARKATTAVDELATAAGRASANIPNIVSIEAWRQRAMGGSGSSGSTSSPVGTVGGGSASGSSGGTNGAGGGGKGDTYYVIQGDVRSDAPDAKKLFEDVRRHAVRDVRTGGVGFREAV